VTGTSPIAAALAKLETADAELQRLHPQPFPLPVAGIEPIVAGAVLGLKRSDWWVPGLRERIGAVLRDVPIDRLVDGFAGARPYKVAPPSDHPALRAVTAVGLALSDPSVAVLVHLGIGSTSDGRFHEALNHAALHHARVIFLVAAHRLDGEAPLGPQVAVDPSAFAAAFGVPCVDIDGRDAEAVLEAVSAARETAGPTLILARISAA
jgi:2-oxoisovalerate dehydrogenase E1 component alpha subunit